MGEAIQIPSNDEDSIPEPLLSRRRKNRRQGNMYCRKCGAQLADRAKFCQKCGTPVELPENINKRDAHPPALNSDQGDLASTRLAGSSDIRGIEAGTAPVNDQTHTFNGGEAEDRRSLPENNVFVGDTGSETDQRNPDTVSSDQRDQKTDQTRSFREENAEPSLLFLHEVPPPPGNQTSRKQSERPKKSGNRASKSRHRTRNIIIVAVVCIALIAGSCTGYVIWRQNQYKRQEEAWRSKGVLETVMGYNPVNYLNARSSSWIQDVSCSYFTNFHGTRVTIMKMTPDGSTEEIYEGDRSELENIQLNKWDDSLYFISNDDLVRVDPESGTSETIDLPDTSHAQDLLIYKDYAYVSANQNGSDGTSVRKYDLDGNKVETLVRSDNEAQTLIYDESLYMFETDEESNLTGDIQVLNLEEEEENGSEISIDFDGTVTQMIPSDGYLYYLLLDDDGAMISLNRYDLEQNQDQVIIDADEGVIPISLTVEGDYAVILLTNGEDDNPAEIIRYDMVNDETSSELIETEDAGLDLPYAELSVSVFVDNNEVKVVSDASFVEGDEPLSYSLPIVSMELDEMEVSYDEVVEIPEEVIEENTSVEEVVSPLRNGSYTLSGSTSSRASGFIVFPTDDGGQKIIYYTCNGENNVMFSYYPGQDTYAIEFRSMTGRNGEYEYQDFILTFVEITDNGVTFTIKDVNRNSATESYYYAADYTYNIEYINKMLNSY